jgi:hypothetical protein
VFIRFFQGSSRGSLKAVGVFQGPTEMGTASRWQTSNSNPLGLDCSRALKAVGFFRVPAAAFEWIHLIGLMNLIQDFQWRVTLLNIGRDALLIYPML